MFCRNPVSNETLPWMGMDLAGSDYLSLSVLMAIFQVNLG